MSLNIFGGHNEGFLSEEREYARHESTPNNTVYINNLNEKVPIEELKDTLFTIFEEYGEIIDVSTMLGRSLLNVTLG
jgi:RNA recognition motif-containing protein